jgi:sulfite reductase (NADPH) flavoprotein alpha-component
MSQERAWQKAQGIDVGPMVLYFGSRHRSEEYLYGEELEAYHADGLLTHLRLAFSRDQREKVYIQHKYVYTSTRQCGGSCMC